MQRLQRCKTVCNATPVTLFPPSLPLLWAGLRPVPRGPTEGLLFGVLMVELRNAPTRSDRRSPLRGADGRVTKCTLLPVLAFLALLFMCSRFKKSMRGASKALISGLARPRADNPMETATATKPPAKWKVEAGAT